MQETNDIQPACSPEPARLNTPVHPYEPAHLAPARPGAVHRAVCAAGMAALLSLTLSPVAMATTPDVPDYNWEPDVPNMTGSGTSSEEPPSGETEVPGDEESGSSESGGGEEASAPNLDPDPSTVPTEEQTGGTESDYDAYIPEQYGDVTGTPVSDATTTYSDIPVDTTEPEAEPEEVQEVAPAAPAITSWDDATRTVTGTAPAGTTVVVMADGAQIGQAVAGDDGIFTIVLPEGVELAAVELTTIDENSGLSSEPVAGSTFAVQQEQSASAVREQVVPAVVSFAQGVDDSLASSDLYTSYEQPASEALPLSAYAIGAAVGVLGSAAAVGAFLAVRGAVRSRGQEDGYEGESEGEDEGAFLESTAAIAAAVPPIEGESTGETLPMSSASGVPAVALNADDDEETTIAYTPEQRWAAAQVTEATAACPVAQVTEATAACPVAPAYTADDDMDELERMAMAFVASEAAAQGGSDTYAASSSKVASTLSFHTCDDDGPDGPDSPRGSKPEDPAYSFADSDFSTDAYLSLITPQAAPAEQTQPQAEPARQQACTWSEPIQQIAPARTTAPASTWAEPVQQAAPARTAAPVYTAAPARMAASAAFIDVPMVDSSVDSSVSATLPHIAVPVITDYPTPPSTTVAPVIGPTPQPVAVSRRQHRRDLRAQATMMDVPVIQRGTAGVYQKAGSPSLAVPEIPEIDPVSTMRVTGSRTFIDDLSDVVNATVYVKEAAATTLSPDMAHGIDSAYKADLSRRTSEAAVQPTARTTVQPAVQPAAWTTVQPAVQPAAKPVEPADPWEQAMAAYDEDIAPAYIDYLIQDEMAHRHDRQYEARHAAPDLTASFRVIDGARSTSYVPAHADAPADGTSEFLRAYGYRA